MLLFATTSRPRAPAAAHDRLVVAHTLAAGVRNGLGHHGQKTGAFVVSRLLLALLAAFFMSLFLLIIGVPYWLPLGLFTGIVSQFIPTIGTYLGILLPCLVAVFNDPLDCV